MLAMCFDDVVNVVLFGEDDPTDLPMVEGTPLSIAIYNFVTAEWAFDFEPLHVYSMGYSTKFRLTKSSREFYKLHSNIVETITSLIKKREISGKKARPNLIDMMLDWNKKCDAENKLEDKYSFNTMVGLLILFYSAGTDTSRASLSSFFFYLG